MDFDQTWYILKSNNSAPSICYCYSRGLELAGDNKTLHFLRRNLIVRPSLEYVSSCWDPHIKEHIEELEKVQRRGTRFVNNYKSRDPGGMDFDQTWYIFSA
jgi:hypothetical protein